MRVRNGSALLWLGLAGVGCGGFTEKPAPPVIDAESAPEVEARACAPGLASRVKVVTPPGSSEFARPVGLTNVQGTLSFFTGTSVGTGTLWRSDGTDVGTVPVKVFANESLLETAPVAVGNKLFFQRYDPATAQVQLWVSDGTNAGTRLLAGFTPNVSGPALTNATALNGQLVFFYRPPTGLLQLWRSDGAATGRVTTLSGVTGLLERDTLRVGNTLLFFRVDGTGTTLWRTDGTLAGTTALKRLDSDAVRITHVGAAGSQGLFVFEDGANHEVWKTNGTEAGTARLDAFGTPVHLLGALGSSVYLSSVETARLRIHRLSLGGGGKTTITTLPNPGKGQSPYVERTTVTGDAIYFSVAYGGMSPIPDDVALWVTQGTATTTRRLFSPLIRTDESDFTSPVFDTGAGVVLFNGVDADFSVEPWFTRGTVATTGQVARIGPAFPGSRPAGYTRSGNRVYFSAFDDTGLGQLWSAPASFICPPGPVAQKQ
ncbi:MAG: hypothetical protein EOO71_03225 [Myxococcaceae bacterium]|nr:MAG: hypothetical protein EOO71_03225 [Myxococcaceae bacterium]